MNSERVNIINSMILEDPLVTHQAIANRLGITRERVRQIFKEYGIIHETRYMRSRRLNEKNFDHDKVKDLLASGKTAKEVAKEIGLSGEHTLYTKMYVRRHTKAKIIKDIEEAVKKYPLYGTHRLSKVLPYSKQLLKRYVNTGLIKNYVKKTQSNWSE